MSDVTGFDRELILEHAQGNAMGFVLATITFCRERGIPVEEWSAFVGERFARGWSELRGQGARAAMEVLALNIVSCGASLEALTGDESRAEAVVSRWPP